MTKKPAENLSSYLAQWGVRVKDVVEITNRPRSTVDDWWKRQDLPMLDNAVKAILWDAQGSSSFSIDASFALSIVAVLVDGKAPLSVAVISKSLNKPIPYVERFMIILRREKIISIKRGPVKLYRVRQREMNAYDVAKAVCGYSSEIQWCENPLWRLKEELKSINIKDIKDIKDINGLILK